MLNSNKHERYRAYKRKKTWMYATITGITSILGGGIVAVPLIKAETTSSGEDKTVGIGSEQPLVNQRKATIPATANAENSDQATANAENSDQVTPNTEKSNQVTPKARITNLNDDFKNWKPVTKDKEIITFPILNGTSYQMQSMFPQNIAGITDGSIPLFGNDILVNSNKYSYSYSHGITSRFLVNNRPIPTSSVKYYTRTNAGQEQIAKVWETQEYQVAEILTQTSDGSFIHNFKVQNIGNDTIDAEFSCALDTYLDGAGGDNTPLYADGQGGIFMDSHPVRLFLTPLTEGMEMFAGQYSPDMPLRNAVSAKNKPEKAVLKTGIDTAAWYVTPKVTLPSGESYSFSFKEKLLLAKDAPMLPLESESASTSTSEATSASASTSESTSASASTSESTSASTSTSEAASASASESTSEAASASASESTSEATSASASTSTSESVSGSTSASTSASTSESASDSLAHPASESTSDSVVISPSVSTSKGDSGHVSSQKVLPNTGESDNSLTTMGAAFTGLAALAGVAEKKRKKGMRSKK